MRARHTDPRRMWRCLPLVLALGLCAAAQTASTSPPQSDDASFYLRKMPEPERVMADVRGSDDLDTAARQVAALKRLIDVVVVLSGTADAPGGPRLTTDERTLNGRYAGAASSLSMTAYRSIDPDNRQLSDKNSRRNQWNALRDGYYNDDAFTGALLQRYLSPELQEHYLAHMRQTGRNIEALRKKIEAARKDQSNALIQPTGAPGSPSVSRRIVLGGIFIGGPVFIVVFVIVVLVFGILWRRRVKKARKRARIQREQGINNQNAMKQFGTTKDERSKNIDSVFDKRAGDMAFDLHTDYIEECHFMRSISGMSPREREVFRTACHLYNLGLFGSETNFYLVRFGLIYADGRAVILGESKHKKYPHYRVSSDDLKAYQGSDGLEAMINLTLHWLEKAIKNNNNDPVLNKLSSRLLGDGGDLVPGAPLKSGVKGQPVEGGLILGLDEKECDMWWYYDGEGSLITVAPPGSGKTQSQVFPNLLMWKGAAVVLDVKGEIYEQTSKWRRDNVGPVYKFSPLDPATSHGYNPLTLVRAEPEYLWEDARFLADMMIVPSGAKDPFWESRARDVLTAAIARVCLEEDVAKRSMGDILDVVHGVGWDEFVAYLEARIDFPSMSRAGHSLATMEPKTRDGVLQSALSSTSAWDGERIARATRKSDWSPLDLRGGKNPTIYICLKSNEVDSYISLLRVFIAQHIRTLTSTKVPEHGVHPILFVLDELPRLRHMPPVEEALEIGRQYGIKLWLFAQSLGQISNAYPNAEGMVGGCAIRMFMNPSLHDETAQKVSDDIGFQESVIDGTRVKVVEPNVLAGPEYKDLVIVMAANARAARLQKYFAYADAGLKARTGSV
jgi:type IV secretion system protein VirD4